jgi:hypothetical protein
MCELKRLVASELLSADDVAVEVAQLRAEARAWLLRTCTFLHSPFISLAPAAGSRVSEAATVQEDNALGVLCGIV